uniref:Uncharacterized protein n=1 Tax=Timema cristinae TaxID=61476 RepID=A0A7R9D1Q5_TIMCR|nr:unnamed protein product [Timema cristinae]
MNSDDVIYSEVDMSKRCMSEGTPSDKKPEIRTPPTQWPKVESKTIPGPFNFVEPEFRVT